MPNPDRLYAKFRVQRTDERDLPGGDKAGARYFVLDYIHDRFARVALAAYADACQSVLPGLAQDLRRRLAWSETTIVAGPEAACACAPDHDHAYPYGCRAHECRCTYFPEPSVTDDPWRGAEPQFEPFDGDRRDPPDYVLGKSPDRPAPAVAIRAQVPVEYLRILHDWAASIAEYQASIDNHTVADKALWMCAVLNPDWEDGHCAGLLPTEKGMWATCGSSDPHDAHDQDTPDVPKEVTRG